MISFASPDEDGASLFGPFLFLANPHADAGACHATPHRTDLFRALSEAIHIVARGAHDPLEAHARVKEFYDWTHVAQRTEAVYEAVVRSEAVDFGTRVRRCVLPLSSSVCDG